MEKKEIINNTQSNTKSSDLSVCVCAREKKNNNSVASKSDEQQQWFEWMQAK